MKRWKFFSVVSLALSIFIVFQGNHIIQWFTKTSFEKVHQIEFNKNSDFEYRATLVNMDDAYVVIEKDAVYLYNATGELMWSKPLSSQNTLVASGKREFVLAEKKAGDIFVIDEKGNIKASVLGIGALQSLKIFDDTYVGAVMTDGTLNIYDEKMNLMGVTKLPNGEMIDFDVNAKRQDIVMGILDLSRTDFNSKLVIAGFNGNIISGSNLIQDVIFDLDLTDDAMWITTDHQLRLYNYDSELLHEISLDRLVNGIYFDEIAERMYLQLTNEESELSNPKSKQTLVCYDSSGKIVYDIPLTLTEINGIKGFDDKMCLYNDNNVYFYDSSGKLLEHYTTVEAIRDVLLTRANTFGIVYDNSMDIYVEK
ncbi:hypothetical protein KHM83_07700 [Fusibacter paucivorans]|uniref:PQQ-like domain-containing protein n=1 Tax=Fusibacter paucivorans TaxID=76009 RepID=A0ABS5PND8_9FIRM|nr:DUF5711 family protein [Fusibacter paucivorans]MBS7526556.1 hypothetical protein [Fusibacter paucivorans]